MASRGSTQAGAGKPATTADSRSSRNPQKQKKRKPICELCGTKLSKRGGIFICQEGHVQQGLREEQMDDEGASNTRKRSLRKDQRKKSTLRPRDRSLQNRE